MQYLQSTSPLIDWSHNVDAQTKVCATRLCLKKSINRPDGIFGGLGLEPQYPLFSIHRTLSPRVIQFRFELIDLKVKIVFLLPNNDKYTYILIIV